MIFIDPADDEINIFLPLVFGLTIIFFVSIIAGTLWILHKIKVANFAKDSHLFSVFRSAVLSVIGVFIISGVIGIVGIFVEIMKNYFAK